MDFKLNLKDCRMNYKKQKALNHTSMSNLKIQVYQNLKMSKSIKSNQQLNANKFSIKQQNYRLLNNLKKLSKTNHNSTARKLMNQFRKIRISFNRCNNYIQFSLMSKQSYKINKLQRQLLQLLKVLVGRDVTLEILA